jgi:hypothetical protein
MEQDKTRSETAKALYRLIKREGAFASLEDLRKIAETLRDFLDGDTPGSVGTDLAIWAGLKADTPEMGTTYGETVAEQYPELETR